MSNDITSTDVQITDLLREDDLDQFTDESPLRGEYSANEFCWTYQKYYLKVTSLEKKGEESKLLAKFNFAQLLKDKTVYINNVTEFKDEHYLSDRFNFCKYKLIVGLNREGLTGGYLLIVDVINQCILKCIECQFSIRNIELIANNSGRQDDNLPLCPELKSMCGIVALSTTNAAVMIVDLCLDTLTNECFDITYQSPSTLTLIVKRDDSIQDHRDLEAKRRSSIIHNQHLCIPVNDECIHKGEFRYSLDEDNQFNLPKEEVYISSLKYFYQTNTLYIGYNFGGVHHFDLKHFSIYKVDPIEDEEEGSLESFPVVGFSLQEPENDPKNFCYLWVLKGQLVQDFGSLNEHDFQDHQYYMCSSISLNLLEFENKNWIDNYGYLYTDFISASTRFNYLLTSNTIDQFPMNSIIVNYGLINQGSILSYRKSKEDTTLLDTSLFHIVWQAFDDQVQTCVYYLMIFDLNQWYQAQMPFNVTFLPGSQFSSFVSFYKLNDLITLTDSGDFQDAQIDSNSFSRYQQGNISNRNSFENEIFYYPSSLSFRIKFLSETKHLDVTHLSIQKKTIKMLNDGNANIWLNPDDFLNKCHHSGILTAEEMNRLTNLKQKKYEQILSIALDNNELPFLAQTIELWSNQNSELDKYGCNCKLFLDWLWNEVEEIKKSIDETVVSLFDLSDTYDSKQVETPLHAYESKLKCQLTLLNKLKSSGTPTTEQGERELDLRLNIIQILIDYIQVILWCCSCNLLPEVEEGNNLTNIGFGYPRTQFQADYEERRKEIVSLNPSSIKHSDLLAIDGLILNTPQIHDLWKTNENSTGLYPPSSIYSLVSIYLEDSVSIEMKHQIMLYLLQDIISYLSDRQDLDQVERLETFSSCFNISTSAVQSVLGMWHLDHKNFDDSLNYFCEPNAKKLDDNLQRRIVSSFLYQNKKGHSLQFIKISNLFNCDTQDKQVLYISVMLSNHLVEEAFNFQRVCRNKENVEDILFHFFFGCEEMKLFESIFKFELDPLEKQTLICYLLEKSKSVNSGNLLIVYLLLNKKFVDAHKFLSIIEERVRKRHLDQDNNYYSKFLNISSIVHSYIQVLPSSVVKLSLEVNNYAENVVKKKSICNLPSQKPKHVQITRSASNNEECSNVTKEILNKIEKLSGDQPTNLPTTPFQNRIKQRGLLLSENLPFVKDLTSKRDRSELKNSLIASHSLSCNEESSFGDDAYSSRLETLKDSENCSELLSLLTTPKIDKQQKNLMANNYNQSASGPSSILKVKQIMNSHPSLQKSSRKKKPSHVSTKLSFQNDKTTSGDMNDSLESDMMVDAEMGSDRQNSDSREQQFNDMSIDVADQSNLSHDEESSFLRTPPPMNPSFVFSPPMTRSKKKQSKHDIDVDHELYSSDADRKQDEKKISKKTTKRSTKIPNKTESRTPSKSNVDTPTHRMSLRGTRIGKKH